MRATRVLMLTIAITAGALPADAQPAEKQALAEARAAAKTALAQHKERTVAALATLRAALDALTSGLQAGQFGTPLMQTFLVSAHAFQLEMTGAAEDADLAIADAFAQALDALGGGAGGLGGKYPAGFYSGTGGPYDDLQAALRTTVATTYLKVRRRTDATVTKARAAGIGLTIQLFEPRPRGFHTPNEGGSVGAFQNPVICHLLVGASVLETSDDGLVLAAGTGSPGGGDVSVLLLGSSPGSILVVQQTTVTAEPGLGGQWSLLLDDEGAGLPEGNYIADAFFTGDLTSTDGRVGVP